MELGKFWTKTIFISIEYKKLQQYINLPYCISAKSRLPHVLISFFVAIFCKVKRSLHDNNEIILDTDTFLYIAYVKKEMRFIWKLNVLWFVSNLTDGLLFNVDVDFIFIFALISQWLLVLDTTTWCVGLVSALSEMIQMPMFHLHYE